MAAYRELFANEIGAFVIAHTRQALNTGLVLRADRFRREGMQRTDQRQVHRKHVPKREPPVAVLCEFLL
jgi:hypothetical protein